MPVILTIGDVCFDWLWFHLPTSDISKRRELEKRAGTVRNWHSRSQVEPIALNAGAWYVDNFIRMLLGPERGAKIITYPRLETQNLRSCDPRDILHSVTDYMLKPADARRSPTGEITSFDAVQDCVYRVHSETELPSVLQLSPRRRVSPARGGLTSEAGPRPNPPDQALAIAPTGPGKHEPTPAALEWLVGELAYRRKSTPAALVRLLADRVSAPFDEVVRLVHGDEGVGDGAIRTNVSRTNQELEFLAVPIRFRYRGGMVHKEATDAGPQRGSNGEVTEM